MEQQGLGTTSIRDWLETDWVLRQLGRDRSRAQFADIDFVRACIGLLSIWEALRNQIYFGSERLPEKVSRGTRGRDISRKFHEPKGSGENFCGLRESIR